MSERFAAAAAAIWLVLSPLAANAHAVLVASRPAPGGALPPGHQALAFRFNSRIDPRRSRLTLLGPGNSATILPISQGSAPDSLEADADLTAGSYRVRWQALTTDGHITRGDVPFTVGSGAPGQAEP